MGIKPPFRTDAPCYINAIPNLNGPARRGRRARARRRCPDAPRDPRAPEGLHRDHRARRRSAWSRPAYILANQATALPSWVPLLGEDRFELNAEFSTAQAVTPGQGQAVNIAGDPGRRHHRRRARERPRQGEDGDRQRQGRADQRGRDDAAAAEDRAQRHDDRGRSGRLGRRTSRTATTLPLSSTLPNVNPDEVLAALDADTQAFLKLLVSGGGEALDPEQGRGVKLSNALRQFEPLARDVKPDLRRPRRAPRERRPLDPQLQAPHRGARRQGRRADRASSTPPTPCSRTSPARRPRSAPRSASCPAP